MVFGYLIPDSYRGFLSRLVGDHNTDPDFKLQTEEEMAFNTNHSTLGAAYINHWWDVNAEVVKTVRDHHIGWRYQDLSRITLVTITANMYCNSIGLNNGVNIQVSPEPVELDHFEMMGLNRKEYLEFQELAKHDIETAHSILKR